MSTQRKLTALLGACAITGALNAASTHAGETTATPAAAGYQMAAVIDRARGNIVLAGDYDRAIAKLGGRPRADFESSTNLCVAYTMTGAMEQADAACAAALASSQETEVRRDIAVALSNLGVVKAVKGDLSGARRDFSRALELESDLRQASKNLQRLRSVAPADA